MMDVLLSVNNDYRLGSGEKASNICTDCAKKIIQKIRKVQIHA